MVIFIESRGSQPMVPPDRNLSSKTLQNATVDAKCDKKTLQNATRRVAKCNIKRCKMRQNTKILLQNATLI
jgi:hypothetical protein